jgi:serine/threonine protein kinase
VANPENEDCLYYLIANKDYDRFWREHDARHPGVFSDELKELILGMLTCDPEKRFTLDQVQKHSYMTKTATLSQ